MAELEIRRALLADAETICRHRRAMFFDMGYQDAAVLDPMIEAFRPWLELKMQSGEYLTWLALAPDGSVAAGLGLWLMDWPPHLIGPGSRRANILNVYTEHSFRRRGLAQRLVDEALAWCRASGIRSVILHASEAGRPLYEKLGFQSTNEMRLLLEP